MKYDTLFYKLHKCATYNRRELGSNPSSPVNFKNRLSAWIGGFLLFRAVLSVQILAQLKRVFSRGLQPTSKKYDTRYDTKPEESMTRKRAAHLPPFIYLRIASLITVFFLGCASRNSIISASSDLLHFK